MNKYYILGLFSASLATLAGFGFICYLGVDFISLCLAAPFLLLGIGIGNTIEKYCKLEPEVEYMIYNGYLILSIC